MKKFLSLVLALALPVFMAVTAFASYSGFTVDQGALYTCDGRPLTLVGAGSEGMPTHVIDAAGILTDDEALTLERMAEQASSAHGCGVYIVTVDDYYDFDSRSPYEAAKTIYRDYGFGMGDGRDGTMLMMSMDDRDYAYIAYGDFGNYAFTDYGKDLIEDAFISRFRNDDWYGGFERFITMSDQYMTKAEAGEPVDVQHVSEESKIAGSVGMGVAASMAGSAMRCQGLKKKMRTVYTKVDAKQYTAPGLKNGLAMAVADDTYLRTTISRVPIPRQSSSRGGGGGTTIDSGGFSGRSGKF